MISSRLLDDVAEAPDGHARWKSGVGPVYL